jgi:predicted negative regulator of RcsB-dependent stress response
MAVYDLEEQEQLSELKAWWNQYGNLVTALAVAAALASVGWQAWQWYQRKQSGEAAALYAVVEQAAGGGDAVKAREAAGQIFEQYGGSAYADLAALLSARAQAEAGDLKNAQAQLSWAVEHGRDPALKDLARLRLATVLLDQGQPDQALAQLQAEPLPEFRARYADVKGDVLAAQGKAAEARAAYQAALAAIGPDNRELGPLRELLTLKMEALGGAAQ